MKYDYIKPNTEEPYKVSFLLNSDWPSRLCNAGAFVLKIVDDNCIETVTCARFHWVCMQFISKAERNSKIITKPKFVFAVPGFYNSQLCELMSKFTSKRAEM